MIARCDRCNDRGIEGQQCARCGGQGTFYAIDHARITQTAQRASECTICPDVALTDTRVKCIHYEGRIWYTWLSDLPEYINCGPHTIPHAEESEKGCPIILGFYQDRQSAFDRLEALALGEETT